MENECKTPIRKKESIFSKSLSWKLKLLSANFFFYSLTLPKLTKRQFVYYHLSSLHHVKNIAKKSFVQNI